MRYAAGIDIGGTKIAAALVDHNGAIVRELKVVSPVSSSESMLDAIASLIDKITDEEDVIGVGVAAAGFLSSDREIMYHSPNISVWRNQPLRSQIAKRTSFPVLLENDANAAGWAEFRFGAGREVASMIMLTIGTGVGGAIIADGKLLRGGFGIGGELGHFTIVPNGKDCGCGQKGCLESYASGTALLASANELVNSSDTRGARLRELAKNNGSLTGEVLYQAILEKDSGALALVEEIGRYLGIAIGAHLVPILDPELAVIGGGVSAVEDSLLGSIRTAYEDSIPAKGFRPELKIVKAHFLNQAGLIGAADLARQSFG